MSAWAVGELVSKADNQDSKTVTALNGQIVDRCLHRGVDNDPRSR